VTIDVKLTLTNNYTKRVKDILITMKKYKHNQNSEILLVLFHLINKSNGKLISKSLANSISLILRF
jgi:ribosomal protein S3AE